MTWVIGTRTPFGHAVLISDTRVTFLDGTQADLIQKSYCVGKYLVAGFAGSVKIGFHLLSDLRYKLSLRGPEFEWSPAEVAKHWASEAATIFNSHDKVDQKGSCNILLAGASPCLSKKYDIWSETFLVRLASPDFTPQFSRKGLAVAQIGSGASSKKYRDFIRGHFRTPKYSVAFGQHGAAFFCGALAHAMSEEIKETPTPGVSPHLHFVACARGELFEGTNNHQTSVGEEWLDFRMPKVATSYTEFQKLASLRGSSTVAAIA